VNAIGAGINAIPTNRTVFIDVQQTGGVTGGGRVGGELGDELPSHATGTMRTYNGPAMLHGTPGNPELVAPVRAFSRQLAGDLAAVVGAQGGAGGGGPILVRMELDGKVLGEALYKRSEVGDVRVAASAVVAGR
jgi:hypothetical protein